MATVDQAAAALRDFQSIFGSASAIAFGLKQKFESIDFSSDTALEQIIALDAEYIAFRDEYNPKIQSAQALVRDLINSLPSGPEKNDLTDQYNAAVNAFQNYTNEIGTFRQTLKAKKKELEDAAKEKVDQSTEKTPATGGENQVNDDSANSTNSGSPNTNVNTNTINTQSSKRLTNPLREFSSVTYKISLYAITPDAINSFYTTGVWKTRDLELLVQSGGVTTGLDSPRNQFFNYDFGIDDLDILTKINSKDTGTVSNSVEFKFKIFEPYAMTFPTRLMAAQKELQQRASIQSTINQQTQALAIPLLLVIRFYGYDQNGAIVTSSGSNVSQTQTDDKAAFERAWPIQISKFSFRLDNKVTVYDITAKLINEQIAYGVKRGVVPTPITVTADTVESALGGTGNSKGLMDQLNSLQNTVTKTEEDKKKQSVADVYRVRFENIAVKDALIVEKDSYVKSKAPLAKVENSSQSTVRTSEQTKTVDKKRVIEIASGTPILTAIDQIISQSTYLTDAMKVIDDEELQPSLENEQTFQKQEPKPLTWYWVVPEVRVIGHDPLRNDLAYEITYVIYTYEVPYLKSLVVGKTTSYRGPSKIYNYWYTGENTEVLSYEQQYNMLYFLGSGLSSESGTPEDPKDTTPNKPIPGQDANPTGKEAGKFELQNSIKTFLYSPGDQIKASIKILGDPDYLMPAVAGPTTDAFSINPNTGQVFVEIGFKQVEDYNTETTGIANDTVVDHGLLKPNDNIMFWDYPEAVKKVTEGRMVFMLKEVISKFNKGTFTQDLKTILPNFSNTETATKTTNTSTAPAGAVLNSDAEQDRSSSAFAATDPRRLDQANQTVNTAIRTGVSLNSAGRSADFAVIDPRRSLVTGTNNTSDDNDSTSTTRQDESGREETNVDIERGTRGGA